MRVIFFIVLAVNVALLAWGQGFFGTPPSEQGRQPPFLSERNQQKITLQTPTTTLVNP